MGQPRSALGIVADVRDLPPLARILGSHPLLHSAEGDLYREVWAAAAADRGLDALHVSPKTLAVPAAVAALKPGPPWQKDHKEAAAAALLALSAKS